VKAFLDNFAAVIGAFTIAIFAMSWAHEYGYFWSIGRQFQTFLTTTDYLTNDALWLPIAVFTVYNNIDWWRFAPQGPPKMNWKSKGTWIWLVVGVGLFIGWLTLVTWPLPFLALITTLLWVSIIWSHMWRGYANKITAEEPFKTPFIEAMRLGPVFLIGMFLYGSVDANKDLTRIDNPYLFKFKNQDAPKLELFLRNFDKGVLIRDAVSNRIQFYRWENIDWISAVAATPTRTPWCWVTGLMCDQPKRVEP